MNLPLLPLLLGAVEPGTPIPHAITLDSGFPPVKVNIKDYTANKKVLILGLPGAFTPT